MTANLFSMAVDPTVADAKAAATQLLSPADQLARHLPVVDLVHKGLKMAKNYMGTQNFCIILQASCSNINSI